jgi:hypothetical protein
MNEEIKKLLLESTNKLISEDTVNKLVSMVDEYIENQLNETAIDFINKEKELDDKFEALKESFVSWLDEVAEELKSEKMNEKAVAEINEDSKKFLGLFSTLSKKYKQVIVEGEDEPEDNDDDEEEVVVSKKKKQPKMAEVEPEKEDDDDEAEESAVEENVKLKKEIENLKKQGLIAEKILQNDKLSEKQKDELSVMVESAELGSDIEAFIDFINHNVEIALAGNLTGCKEAKLNESEDETKTAKLVKPAKTGFKESKVDSTLQLNLKGISGKLL